MKIWILQASPADWDRKGLRVFKEKAGALAEMENNFKPEYQLRNTYERIEHTRDDLMRFLYCFEDGEESYEVAQAVPIQIEGNREKVWVLTIPKKPRDMFQVYATKEEAQQAFLKIYEDAGKRLTSYYDEDGYLYEYSPHDPEAENSKELATATQCPIEDTPQKLCYECPKCHFNEFFYIKDNKKYVVELRYGSRIVHDSLSLVDSTAFKEEPPFYMCSNCFRIVMSEGRVIRDQNSLADHIIRERENKSIWLEISRTADGY